MAAADSGATIPWDTDATVEGAAMNNPRALPDRYRPGPAVLPRRRRHRRLLPGGLRAASAMGPPVLHRHPDRPGADDRPRFPRLPEVRLPVAGGGLWGDFARFLSVWMGGAIAGLLVTPLLVEVFHVWPFAAQIVAVAVVSVLSFLAHRVFSFRLGPNGGRRGCAPPKDELNIRLSIIVPCYGSARTLPTLIDRLIPESCHRMSQNGTVEDWELLLVVDGSPDDAAAVAAELARAPTRDAIVTAAQLRSAQRLRSPGYARGNGRHHRDYRRRPPASA